MTEFQHETDQNDPAEVVRSARAPWTISHGKSDWGGLPLDPASTLFVSLFLVLFAFFAVMNANATEKTHEAAQVMESLRSSFGGSIRKSDVGTASDPHGKKGPVSDPQLSKAYQSVVSDFPDAQIMVSARGNEFAVSVSLSEFFIRDTSRLAPSRELFLKSIASIAMLTPEKPLMITIQFPDYGSNIDGQRRVATLAATLGKYGVLADGLLAIGSRGEAGQIRLIVGRG